MSKHTPGPWEVIHDEDQLLVRSANADDLDEYPIVFDIAENIGGHRHGPDYSDYYEIEANARLIAAAPDLLEALQRLVNINEEHNQSMIKIIGKPLMWNDSYLDAARAAIAKATGGAE